MDPSNQFQHQRFMALETYRKDGTPVRTPVGFVQEGDTWLVRTLAHTGKVKRMRANPAVQMTPSTGRGEPLGTWVAGTAQILDDAANDQPIRALMLAKYGLIWRVLEGVNAVTSRLRGQGATRWIGVRITVGSADDR